MSGGGGDGTFDSDEIASVTVPPTGADGTTVVLNFTIPNDFVLVANEPTFARFRIGSVDDQVSSPTGAADDGEIEDYLIPANTLPVSLNYFGCRRGSASIAVEWTTVSESFSLGFEVLGKVGEDWVPLTR